MPAGWQTLPTLRLCIILLVLCSFKLLQQSTKVIPRIFLPIWNHRSCLIHNFSSFKQYCRNCLWESMILLVLKYLELPPAAGPFLSSFFQTCWETVQCKNLWVLKIQYHLFSLNPSRMRPIGCHLSPLCFTSSSAKAYTGMHV
jgi:hypothetical protein